MWVSCGSMGVAGSRAGECVSRDVRDGMMRGMVMCEGGGTRPDAVESTQPAASPQTTIYTIPTAFMIEAQAWPRACQAPCVCRGPVAAPLPLQQASMRTHRRQPRRSVPRPFGFAGRNKRDRCRLAAASPEAAQAAARGGTPKRPQAARDLGEGGPPTAKAQEKRAHHRRRHRRPHTPLAEHAP